MPESKFIKTFRKIHREYPEMFQALEDYDRTHKLKKLSYKERANFTIDARLLRKFRSYCAEHGYSMSKILEQCIGEWLRKK